jgi:hypothetical protein
VINDPAISEYVNPAGQNIVRDSVAYVPFTIRVIDSNDVNAFAFKRRCRRLGSGLRSHRRRTRNLRTGAEPLPTTGEATNL